MLRDTIRIRLWRVGVLCLGLMLMAADCFALDPHQGLRHYGYQSWQTDSGLPQNTVHAVLQTRDGYLWIGTEAGLVRFDSTQFVVFTRKNTPQLGSDLIYSLMEDRSGALWIGTSSGVTRYRNRGFEEFAQRGPAPASAVWSMHEDGGGGIWMLTAAGLVVFEGQNFRTIADLPGLNEESTLAEGADGSLWVGTMNGLRYSPAGSRSFQAVGEATPIQALAVDRGGHAWAATTSGAVMCSAASCAPIATGKQSLTAKEQSVHALAVDAKGTLWMGTDAGLLSFDGKDVSRLTSGEGLPSNRVDRLFCDHEGALWIGTEGGLARLYAGKIEAFTPKEGFSSNVVLAMYEDREGSLWLGTESGGLDILRDRKFTTYTAEDGISDDHIRAVYQDHAGTVWLGTSGGGLDSFDNGRRDRDSFTAMTTADGLSSNVVLSIASGPDGDLWLGTPDGLDRMRGKHITAYTSADGLADDFVRSIYFDNQGAAWIGTRRGLSQWKDGRFTTYTALDGLGSDLVGAILQSKDGSLWISTLGGLTHYSHGVFHNYTEKDGLSNRVVTALYEDGAGTLWIGTNGGGLNRMRGGRIVPVAVRSADLAANIYSILEDEQGNLWISSNRGVDRVGRDALNHAIDGGEGPAAVASYGAADGMKISEASSGGHPAAWHLQDGALWFAMLKGVATVDPMHLAMNRVAPLVSIENLSVDEEPQKDTVAVTNSPVTVSPGNHRLSFEYAALSFVAPQKVRFEYRLSGFDHGWVDAGARRTAYYTNLPPGHYIFEVRACNNDGVWSLQPAMLGLRLKPFFYQTIWFYLLLVFTAGLLGYAIYLWRLRQVESRFQVVLAERNRIAREIHDTLAQGFVAVSVQLQIASRLLGSAPAVAQQYLGQAQDLVRSGIDDARRAIWELRSQDADESDFASKLIKMAKRVTASSAIAAKVDVHGIYHPLPAQTEDQLLRIAQEAVTNSVKHGQPTNIAMELRFTEKTVEMIVADDGCGFDGEPLSMRDGHYGMTGMRERAEQVGGRLSVSSKKGEGTRIHVEVPQTQMKDNE